MSDPYVTDARLQQVLYTRGLNAIGSPANTPPVSSSTLARHNIQVDDAKAQKVVNPYGGLIEFWRGVFNRGVETGKSIVGGTDRRQGDSAKRNEGLETEEFPIDFSNKGGGGTLLVMGAAAIGFIWLINR